MLVEQHENEVQAVAALVKLAAVKMRRGYQGVGQGDHMCP
jgi:predicted DNA-binding WGR domain protein